MTCQPCHVQHRRPVEQLVAEPTLVEIRRAHADETQSTGPVPFARQDGPFRWQQPEAGTQETGTQEIVYADSYEVDRRQRSRDQNYSTAASCRHDCVSRSHRRILRYQRFCTEAGVTAKVRCIAAEIDFRQKIITTTAEYFTVSQKNHCDHQWRNYSLCRLCNANVPRNPPPPGGGQTFRLKICFSARNSGWFCSFYFGELSPDLMGLEHT